VVQNRFMEKCVLLYHQLTYSYFGFS